MATAFGAKLVAEAKAQVEARGAEDVFAERLTEAFKSLKELVTTCRTTESNKTVKQWWLASIFSKFSYFSSAMLIVLCFSFSLTVC